jgi:3',5'-cyclic AMP phosphodiesterase CpdA
MSVPRGSAPAPRLLHVSDLHFGARDAHRVGEALQALIERTAPELVVASGDLTHRGRPDQHAAAASFLRSLGPPVLAIPGNHDIPYTFPGRFTRTFTEFERHWETTEPVFRSPTLHVVGLNSVRAWRHQSGGIRESQLDRARQLLAESPDGALRIVAMHHHLLGAPWRSRKKPVARRSHVLAALVDSGAELILAGHIHQAAVSERHEFEVIAGRGVVVSIAPGLGQPRPNRRGEARGLHLYECDEHSIRVETYVWREADWGLTAMRRFARGREPLWSSRPGRAEPSSTHDASDA